MKAGSFFLGMVGIVLSVGLFLYAVNDGPTGGSVLHPALAMLGLVIATPFSGIIINEVVDGEI